MNRRTLPRVAAAWLACMANPRTLPTADVPEHVADVLTSRRLVEQAGDGIGLPFWRLTEAGAHMLLRLDYRISFRLWREGSWLLAMHRAGCLHVGPSGPRISVSDVAALDHHRPHPVRDRVWRAKLNALRTAHPIPQDTAP